MGDSRKRGREEGGGAPARGPLRMRSDPNATPSSASSAPLMKAKGPSTRSSVASTASSSAASSLSMRSGAAPGNGSGSGSGGRPRFPASKSGSHSARAAMGGATLGGGLPPTRRNGQAALSGPLKVAAETTAPAAPAVAATAATATAEDPDKALWAVKRCMLEEEVKRLADAHQRLRADKEVVLDAIEGMLLEFETTKQTIQAAASDAVAAHLANMKTIKAQEEVCLAKKQRALMEAVRLRDRVNELAGLKDAAREAIVLETETTEELERGLQAALEQVTAQEALLASLKEEEEKMKDASYGLSGEVRDMVVAMEQLQQQRHQAEVAAMETEIARRALYATCEELKGSIRVFCRVKGSQKPSSPSPFAAARAGPTATAAERLAEDDDDEAREGTPPDEEAEGSPTTPGMAPHATGTTSHVPSPSDSPPARSALCEDGLTAACLSARGSTASTSTTASGRCRRRQQQGSRGGPHGGATAAAAASLRSLLHSHVGPTSCAASARGSEAGSAVSAAGADGDSAGGCCPDEIYSFPDGANAARRRQANAARHGTASPAEATVDAEDEDEFALPRTIAVHQSRRNATSTGQHSMTDTFSFDYVFDHHATQAEVYQEVEPLVNSAIDGYRVCIFAYGQTGSGKTYTMEGSLKDEEGHGIIPRALASVFARQESLAKEGWSYSLSCTMVEIYNDVIRDLLQSPSLYDKNGSGNTGGAGGAAAAFHTIKHQGENTAITNVKSATLACMEDFRRVYKLATQHRRTARTQLNERSSRSHCIFTLHIDGVNATIRQRSAGVLCLVDLAGSERVNESGVQGQQFKEAVNINKSLLDLGKCIHAMRGATVAPWRNCKLTYLLQNYLGAKGGKMLMLVNISDRRQHLAESVNSLRFATRVSETVVGKSVKRVTNF